jgi:hypothetical protein
MTQVLMNGVNFVYQLALNQLFLAKIKKKSTTVEKESLKELLLLVNQMITSHRKEG